MYAGAMSLCKPLYVDDDACTHVCVCVGVCVCVCAHVCLCVLVNVCLNPRGKLGQS